ncbi:GTP-binding protein 8 [Aplysia californica]|uniref:GTP-binding protein 8 n=1 Tax=Aplysia californica TaxID=6500 RepID=A0ABM1ACG9_APLCA|nr:GTP-binding protein 8 [Aplysia californica]
MARLAAVGVLMRPKCSSQSTWSQRKYLHAAKSKLAKATDFQPVPQSYTNPVDRLQPHVQVPIIPDSEYGFQPSREEIQDGASLFEPKNTEGEMFKFLGSWPNPHIMPKSDVPEVAFIGKSNVGKSSLLAAIFTLIPSLKVRTSSKPGHTKLMNVFNVNDCFHLVDMPGYGFNMPDHFETSVEAYLKARRNLQRVFMLVDADTGPTEVDYLAVEMMEEASKPYVMVLTKIDLAKQGTLIRNLMAVLKFRDSSKAHSCFPQPFLVSSHSGEGVAFLQTFIAYITGHLNIKSLSGAS